MDIILPILYSLLATAATLFACRKPIHMLQLESYQGNMYLKWILRAGKKDILSGSVAIIAAILIRIGSVFLQPVNTTLATLVCYAADLYYIGMLALSGYQYKKQPMKKPLKFTGRVIRLLWALGIVVLAFSFALFVPWNTSSWEGFIAYTFIRYLPGLLPQFFVLFAHLLTLPIENSVKKWYFNDAKRKLMQRDDLIKIGITGSYGKTSTKFMLGTILQEKYNTLVTPSSFNTPMGVTRIIREQLTDAHEVFVAEMGARYVGDIKELCGLVHPKYGIITSVGKQHLETFGSYEAVISTKSELLSGLPADGAAFINGDNPDCQKMHKACKLKNKFLFGFHGKNLYMRAENLKVTPNGSTFTLISKDKKKVNCQTVLLGQHNILNITGAAALAHYLGLTMDEIAAGIAKLKPISHRLELIPGPVTVIDDAFNANPAGTKAALQVLSSFPGRRLIVTPGMIELGEEEAALNEAFGEDIAKAADIAILIGKAHADPIERGLKNAGFPTSCIIRVASLDEATQKLPLYTEPGCVVLIENDLPDNYNE